MALYIVYLTALSQYDHHIWGSLASENPVLKDKRLIAVELILCIIIYFMHYLGKLNIL